MKVALLSANLGNFDVPVDPVQQETKHEVVFHRWTDENFPPIAGIAGRFQYRIPKLFGWEMFPGYDVYIWFDASCSLQRPDCVDWYLKQLGYADVAFFKHPHRNTIKEEVDHIEKKLKQGHPYMVPRYANGLHKEMYEIVKNDLSYADKSLYTSTAFVYRNNFIVRETMKKWWFYQSRYYTVDQVSQPYVFHKAGVNINVINENQYAIGYLSLVHKHK